MVCEPPGYSVRRKAVLSCLLLARKRQHHFPGRFCGHHFLRSSITSRRSRPRLLSKAAFCPGTIHCRHCVRHAFRHPASCSALSNPVSPTPDQVLKKPRLLNEFGMTVLPVILMSLARISIHTEKRGLCKKKRNDAKNEKKGIPWSSSTQDPWNNCREDRFFHYIRDPILDTLFSPS